ncbi:MAG TPA: cytochrome ubiquinol oxidase subunit I, partial [Candidatus Paceibacterota bacterium]|nr:cytochrome ubiquinol oxidase subunit I [Candidatus Paceibacterota bacterium]
DTIVSFSHMWLACIESTLFLMTGIAAIVLLTRVAAPEVKEFFLRTFKYCIALALIVTPLQMFVGDLSGLTIAHYQPQKLAATELHWNTNPQGEGAAWSIVALPASGGGANAFEVNVPNGLSMLITHSLTGSVQGLNDFAPDDRPTLIDDVIVFYSFRIMAGIGVVLFLITLWACWLWWRGKLSLASVVNRRVFLWLFALATPLGFIATEAGWMVREIGRQPWVVYHLLRTQDGLSANLDAHTVAATTGIFTLIYIAFGVLFVYFTWRIVKKGPDFTAPVP